MQNNLSMHFAPFLPDIWLYSLIGAGILILLLSAWQLRRLPILRTLVFAAFILALYNPSLHEEKREPLTSIALIIVDKSASQTFSDRARQTEQALDHLKKNLEPLKSIEARIIEGPENGALASRTDLYALLNSAFGDVPPARRAGVIFITDGQVHDVPDISTLGEDFRPVHILLSGHENEKDRRLHIIDAPAFGIVGQKVTIKYKIEDSGDIDQPDARITLKKAGQPPEVFFVPVGEEQTLELSIEHAGQNVFELSTETFEGELTTLNNRAAIELQGIRDRLRVLLISGRPHAGGRTWRDLLTSDPGVDLVHFTILREPEKVDTTPSSEMSLIAFPFRELFETKLYEFDLIIFDRYSLNRILPDQYFQNITNYVRDGGAFLEISGPDYTGKNSIYNTPIKPLLPGIPTGKIYTESFLPSLTIEGLSHPVTRDLKTKTSDLWGPWLRQVGVTASGSDVLMKGYNHNPLLMLKRIDNGRVAQIASDHIWLWSHGYKGGGPYTELLRRIIHWSMKEPSLDERALNVTTLKNTIKLERPNHEKDSAAIKMTSPSGVETQITLKETINKQLEASIQADQQGIYEFQTTDGQSRFAIIGDADPLEFQDALSTKKILEPLTKKSGGTIIRLSETKNPSVKTLRNSKNYGGKEWIGLRNNTNYKITGAHEKPLLPIWLTLSLLITMTIFCWWTEGKKK